MLLTFDAMTGRMKGCGERGADTDCEHPSGHGGAHDLLPVPCRLQQQRVCSRGRKQKSWRTKIVADNVVLCNLSIKILCKPMLMLLLLLRRMPTTISRLDPYFFKKKRCTRARIKSSLSRSFVHYPLYNMLMNYIVN